MIPFNFFVLFSSGVKLSLNISKFKGDFVFESAIIINTPKLWDIFSFIDIQGGIFAAYAWFAWFVV